MVDRQTSRQAGAKWPLQEHQAAARDMERAIVERRTSRLARCWSQLRRLPPPGITVSRLTLRLSGVFTICDAPSRD